MLPNEVSDSDILRFKPYVILWVCIKAREKNGLELDVFDLDKEYYAKLSHLERVSLTSMWKKEMKEELK